MPRTTTERESKPVETPASKTDNRSLKRKRTVEDHASLQARVENFDPKGADDVKDFAQLPISEVTKSGLAASHFKSLTEIQAQAIPLALAGRDILGAAKTGSGKTLAFLVPVLENLYRQQWTTHDGLGALIITPTRELANQIFKELRKIGRNHAFSAGCTTGGMSLQEERDRMEGMNILVCTPGRMLQHLDQTATIEVNNLQMLVLDEADRIMDMGFKSVVDAILDHLPKTRQTMLFSATQTKQISDLSRMSLKAPEYVSVHEAASSATPTTLQQHYIVTPLPEKLNTLFSFIRCNLKSKIIVFMSSGKQVRFIYEAFRHMQPGIPLLHLHGRQKQTARVGITSKFASSTHSCLFATDVVARGLDFPAVTWVIQMDCPEDADTYIHRVGRTARYNRAGRAVLFLDPSEEDGMLKRLAHKKVPILKINVVERKKQSVTPQLQNMCLQDPALKYLGQKAFISYTKSVFVQKDKDIFKLKELDLEGFAANMGLPGTPKIKFQQGDDAKQRKNAPRAAISGSEDDSDDVGINRSVSKKEEVRTKYDRMFERRNQDVLSGHYSKLLDNGDTQEKHDVNAEAEDGDDFLSVKRVHKVDNDDAESESSDAHAVAGPQARVISGIGKETIVIDSKRKEKMLKSKKAILRLKDRGQKLVFDSDGEAHEIYELENEDDFRQRGTAADQRSKFVTEEGKRIADADLDDKALVKQKKKERREKLKQRMADTARADRSDDEAPGLVDDGNDEDPLALLASLPIDSDEENDRLAKRPKKWFETDVEGQGKMQKHGGRGIFEDVDEPETLEDLEALASGLLE